jgi:hypothetical protein
MRPNKLKQIRACGKAAANCRLMLPSAISAEMLAHQGWDSMARPGLKAGISAPMPTTRWR